MMKEFHYLFYFLNGTFGIHVIQRNGVAIIKILRKLFVKTVDLHSGLLQVNGCRHWILPVCY